MYNKLLEHIEGVTIFTIAFIATMIIGLVLFALIDDLKE